MESRILGRMQNFILVINLDNFASRASELLMTPFAYNGRDK